MARFDLDDAKWQVRRALDADWSKHKKLAVGIGAGVLALAAIGGGVWAYVSSLPPGLPKTAEQAVATIQSAKFERLDPDRKEQILAESRRLMRDMSWEERRELLGDDEARMALMEANMDEAARRLARGEGMGDMWRGMMGGGRPGGEEGREELTEEERQRRAEEWERRRQEMEAERASMTDEERLAAQKEREAAMRERMSSQFQSGNAQNTGLRGEFFKRMRAMREQGGGGFRRPGGGGPGGRPGGGGG